MQTQSENDQDAEDVLQATFLVLARNAASPFQTVPAAVV